MTTRGYDPALPLYSIHLPKCGGSSFTLLLRGWFGERFHAHYRGEVDNAPPQRFEPAPGSCVHGHFNRAKGIGVLEYYPDAQQIVTVLRDPLEMAISNYFYWRDKARAKQLARGQIKVGGDHDYRDIEDFFAKRPASAILDFLPLPVDGSNYREVIDRFFIHVGFLEDGQAMADRFARLLGFPSRELPRVNVSPRDTSLPQPAMRRFVADNALAYAIFRYARERFPG